MHDLYSTDEGTGAQRGEVTHLLLIKSVMSVQKRGSLL
jgi:hypothetical protein